MTSFRSHVLHTTLQRVLTAMDIQLPLQEQRARLDELARALIRPPRSIRVQRTQVGAVTAEWIDSKDSAAPSTILYLHGGGYCIGSLDTHRALAARIALASCARVLNLDYRLAPEHPFPAALEDALAAYRWLLDQGIPPERLAIGGDSAGGGLTLAAAIKARDEQLPLPAALFLISPWTDLTLSGETILTRKRVDPIFGRQGNLHFTSAYTGGFDPSHPLISPLFADLRDLPPTKIQVGNDEILLSDSTRMEERLHSAGVEVELEIWPGMWHVFQIFAPLIPEAPAAIEKIGLFLCEQFHHNGKKRIP